MEQKTILNEQNAKNAAAKKMSPRERAGRNPRSAKMAIAAYCYHECHSENSSNSHNTKRAIKNCTITTCALWPHRGWRELTGNKVG